MLRRLGRFVFWLIAVLLALVAAAFAIANRSPVAVRLDPAPFVLKAPLYVITLGTLALGMAIGLIVTWPALARWRSAAHQRAHSVALLEDELARLNRGRAAAARSTAVAIVPGAGPSA
ncbi:MAG: LapA family protein [Alphaproteobacteria bacterium]|nr:LapA family protein [Alphaproteobacteria bacterium]